MGNNHSLPGIRSNRNMYQDRSMPGRHLRGAGFDGAHQYSSSHLTPQSFAQQSFGQSPYPFSPMQPPPIPQPLFPPIPATNPYPVIPNMPPPPIPQPTPQARHTYPTQSPRRRRDTPGPRFAMPMPSPAQPAIPPSRMTTATPMAFPSSMPQPVIPPQPGMAAATPRMHMPMPMSTPGLPQNIPIYPAVQPPVQPVIPAMPTPMPQAMPQPVIPPTPVIPSQPGATPGPRLRPGVQLGGGQGATPRPRWSRLFERPKSLHFMRHPLPKPPSIILEKPEYLGLLDELRKDPEERLRRSATMGLGTRYVIAPTQGQGQFPGMPVVPVMPYAPQERKEKRGLFRTLSDALRGGRSRGKKQRPPVPQVFYDAPPVTRRRPARVPVPYQDMPVQPNVSSGYPGNTPGPMHSASTRMPSPGPSFQAMPRAPSPAHSVHSVHSVHGPPRAPSPAGSVRMSPRVLSPARSSPRPRTVVSAINEFADLLHTSPHPITYQGEAFPTAYHLLESFRFDNEQLIDLIRHSRSVQEVRDIVQRNSALIRPDWENVVLKMMDEVLSYKFEQHPHLLNVLLRTEATELAFDDRDDFWGIGPTGGGANELGKALMRARDRLKGEPPRP